MSHDRYDSTRQAWENIWQEADVLVELEAVQSARSLETIALYEAHLPKDDLILEAGSGLSAVVMTLRQKGYSIMGIDYAINALYASKQYEPSLGLGGADVHHLPFANDTFGAYLSFGVLKNTLNRGCSLRSRKRTAILKPNGVIVLTIPYPNATSIKRCA
ncbi:MAG UNVERIFIED_CONTAM: class I SAM-dependent methyltransferase [Anaerolineae bacterium]|jgi:SAM-dependent methyltransferase